MAEGDGEGQTTGAQSATPDVFISYASQDAAVASAVVAALERQGLKCWIAPRDVMPGALYADEIIRSINGAKALVLVLSENAVGSPHVGKEVERASSKRRPIITLRTDAAPLTTALEYFLSESQWVDMGTDGTEVAFAKLITAVRRHLTPPSIVDPAHADASAKAAKNLFARPVMDKPVSQRVSRPVIALGALIALVVVYLAADKLWFSTRDAAEKPVTAMVPPVPSFNPPPHSVAVLPFTNLSGDPKQEYFSDGISEELINALSHIDSLQVIARTSSFSFKGQNVDIGTISRKLNVAAILEGSIRREGNTVRITAQLINAVNGFHMWSQDYDRDLKDVLALQSDIAISVAQELQARLLGDEAAKIEVGGTHNPRAYDAYLRGTQLLTTSEDEAGDRAALAEFDQAIALDPLYAAAYARRADALIDIVVDTRDASIYSVTRDQARTAAARAIALAPDLAQAHTSLAGVFINEANLAGAAPEMQRALELAPGKANIQANFAGFASLLAHHDAAISAARRAISLDPQNYHFRVTLAQCLFRARGFADALVAAEDARAVNPSGREAAALTAFSYLALGQLGQAQKLCESAATPIFEPERVFCLSWLYHSLGRPSEAESEFARWRALKGDSDAVETAGLYAQWGNTTAALHWLAIAERTHDPGLQGIRAWWMLDPIRNEPQFKALERRLNFPP